MKKYSKVLHIFRRDLRLQDNTALLDALKNSDVVLPCFIFDPRQITDKNAYYSSNAVQFMQESLVDLQKELESCGGKLYLFHGLPETVLAELYKKIKFEAVFLNHDYTPFSTERDATIAALCTELGIDFCPAHDLMLNAPEDVKKNDGNAYSVFTPYFKKASGNQVAAPQANSHTNYFKAQHIVSAELSLTHSKSNPNIAQHGGRAQALKILKTIAQFKNYEKIRDIPSIATTLLSAHNKFGTVSIREVHAAITEKLGIQHPLIRQLYWRDFFTQLAYHFPHVFGHAFHEKYEHVPWHHNADAFERWCTGKTGFPLVDAGMRQLQETGFMHNRVRMIVGSFLVKDLHIDWRVGEKYFAQQLVDYDPAVNNGNWQWVASTGADAQPYFRIFNPWIQQKKFDPECTYIKTWLPELKNIPAPVLHAWNNPKKRAPFATSYPAPLLDHASEAKKAHALYKKSATGYRA